MQRTREEVAVQLLVLVRVLVLVLVCFGVCGLCFVVWDCGGLFASFPLPVRINGNTTRSKTPLPTNASST